MLDDFHNVHGYRVPTKLATSKASHMASCVIDIQLTVPAVPPDMTRPLHRPATILKGGNLLACPGGIGEEATLQLMSKAVAELNYHFFESLPAQLQELDAKHLQQSLKELR